MKIGRVSLVCIHLLLATQLGAQLIFSTNNGLFERVNGQSVRVDSGVTTGLYPGLSRNGRFLTYSQPDLVSANGSNGLNPSSDLIVLDRATGIRRTLINHETLQIGADFDPLSSQISPSGQVVAYGLRIGPSFGASYSTTTLVIANLNTGLAVSEPMTARNTQFGNTSDALFAEFRGISFFPNSDSFVTPVLSLVNVPNSAAADAVAAITRFDRANNGEWFAAATLSTPQARATGFIAGIPADVSVNYQVYPAISPNGTGLAYFDVFRPSRLGGQASSCAVMLANSDGSNVRNLTGFNPGFVPTGLTWTADGTALVVSVSEQVNLGTGFLDLPNTANSAVFNVPVSGGTSIAIPELGNGFGPVLPAVLPGSSVNLTSVTPELNRDGNGGLIFRVPNLPAGESFEIQSSTSGSLTGFSGLRSATGAELNSGVPLEMTGGRTYFRLGTSGR